MVFFAAVSVCMTSLIFLSLLSYKKRKGRAGRRDGRREGKQREEREREREREINRYIDRGTVSLGSVLVVYLYIC